MKKLIAMILCLTALLLTLAGCGTDTASAGNASGGNAYASYGDYVSYGDYASYGDASDGNAN